MSEVAQVPQLRFPEFSGNWEEVPFYDCLNDILDFRGRTPLKIGMDWGGGNIISLSANNVKNGYIDFNAECHLGSGELYEKWMGKVKLVKNDIVFTMEAPLGKALLVPDDKRYILSQRVVAFKTKDYIDNLYFIQLIWSNKFQNTVDRLSTGSTAKGINQKSLKKVFVNIPLKPEQQKIAAFLTAVDTKIEQLSKKKALLGEYKKGLMQQIFSQAIRFKADDGSDFPDWEEKKLGDVCKLQGGYAFKSAEFQKHGIPIIRISNISNNNDFIDNRNLVYYNEIKNSDKFIIKNGDLIVAMSGATTGKSSIYNLIEDAYLNQRVGLFKANNSLLDYGFLIQIVFSYIFATQLDSVLVAGAQPNVSSKDIEGFEISLPSKIEQNKIANFLSSIDSKIEQVGKQLDESNQFKKALLQQMFV